MNLHDFVAEPVNPVHSFHDAHTVSLLFWTADHIADVVTCLSARIKPAQFWSAFGHVFVWKVFGTCDDGIWSHSWSPTRVLVRGHSSGLVKTFFRTRGVPTRVLVRGHSFWSGGLVSHSWCPHEKPRQDANGLQWWDTVLAWWDDLALVESHESLDQVKVSVSYQQTTEMVSEVFWETFRRFVLML